MSLKTLPSTRQGVTAKNIDVQIGVRHFFGQIGEDPNRDGIKETPRRFEEAVKYFLSGYDRNLSSENKLFDNHVNYKDIIILKNIDYFSMCEHHLLPFFGYAHIGYLPGKKVLGISKLSRAVEIYSRRLQDQETLVSQIAEAILTAGEARGVAVILEGKHFCNISRGVEKKLSVMTTCVFKGSFVRNKSLQNKFLRLIADRKVV